MNLKSKYIIFIGLLHVVLIVLIYFLLKDKIWRFIISEFLIFLSLYFSYLLYQSFIQPINLLQSGTDAIKDADFSIKYLKTGSHEIDKLVNVYNEMIERLRQERTKMSEQSFFIQKLIEVTPIGIIILDYDGLIANINPAAKKILNISHGGIGKKLNDYPSSLIQSILALSVGQSKIISINGIDKYKCQVNEVIHQGFKRKFLLINDLSYELLQSEKEAYGQIIRMMAHEVNNSIGAINSILDTVIEFGFSDNKDTELKESLAIAQKRNVSLSTFMANYASILRLPKPNKKSIELPLLLKKMGQLFYNSAKEKNINIEYEIPSQKITVLADAVLLEQAISNMLKNAIEAIGENGCIKIACSENPTQFTISDNGEGIDEEIEQKLFTPFFSTKATGQGVGLMLIRDILQSHNTTFSLKTDPLTKWTHFKVVF